MPLGKNQSEGAKTMITATARIHIAKALRERLHISDRDARSVLTTSANGVAVLDIERDMRGCVALAASNDRWVSIYARDPVDGLYDHVVSLDVPAPLRERWETGSIEEAYRVPDHVTFRAMPPCVDRDAIDPENGGSVGYDHSEIRKAA